MKKILLLFFVIVTSLYAQSWHYITKTNSNIPSNYIRNIFVDKTGDIWMATGDTGIVRYSGSNFYSYNSTNTDSIERDDFNFVIKDDAGYYWFSSAIDGIYASFESHWYHFSPEDMGFDLGPYELLRTRTLAIQNGGPFSTYGGALWIGTYGAGVIKFDGTTWTKYPGTNETPFYNVFSIAVEESPTDSSYVVWIGSSNGLIKYDGTNWSLVKIAGDSTKWINAIALEDGGPTFSGGKLYVGTELGEFCIYDGSNWEIFNLADAYNPNNSINAIAIDASKRKWIGTSDEGLAMYDGQQFPYYYKSNSGIPGNNVTSVAICEQKDSTEILLSCFDNDIHDYTGLTIMRVEKITGVEKETDGLNYSFELEQNYPNPFNPSTTISYSIPSNLAGKTVEVKLIVYDVLGKEIATLVNESESAGRYSIKFNAGNLPSGLYFYKLQAGNFVDTKKMMLIK